MSGRSTRSASARRFVKVALSFGLAGALGVFHVWSRTQVMAAGYRLAAVQQDHGRLVSEYDRLRLEVEALRAPQALEAYARTKLGMAPPDPGPVWAGRAMGGGNHLSGPAEPALFSSQGELAVRSPRERDSAR